MLSLYLPEKAGLFDRRSLVEQSRDHSISSATEFSKVSVSGKGKGPVTRIGFSQAGHYKGPWKDSIPKFFGMPRWDNHKITMY